MSKIRKRKATLKCGDTELIHCDYCGEPVEYLKSMTSTNGKTTCYPCLEILEGPTEFCSFECIATNKCDGSC
jgi:hypothetical protein